jgi:hypothetical protein
LQADTHVLGFEAGLQRRAAQLASEAALLPASEWRLQLGHIVDIDAHTAGFQPLGSIAKAVDNMPKAARADRHAAPTPIGYKRVYPDHAPYDRKVTYSFPRQQTPTMSWRPKSVALTAF